MNAYTVLGIVSLCGLLTSNEAFAYGRGAGARGGTVNTARGGTIQYGGAAAGHSGPAGGGAARGVGGVQYTSPGGQTATRVGTANAARGPGGATAVNRASVGAGPNGGVAVNRSAAAGGPAGGGVAVNRSAAAGPYGGVAASRGAAAVGPNGGVAASRGGAAVGPRGGAAVAHSTYHATNNYVAARGVAVRGGYNYHAAYFNRGWYVSHPNAWTAARITAASVWVASTYAAASSYIGISAPPISYDYGTTIVYEDNSVYINGEKSATAEEYAASATAIADTGRAATLPIQEEWKPLGVFGMVQGEETVANTLFQLSINKDGVIRGNYYDALGDNNLPVYGSVDKKTQRAAWSVGEKKEIVYEAGLSNLTQPESTVLIHYGKEKTRQMVLIRLEEPKGGGGPPK